MADTEVQPAETPAVAEEAPATLPPADAEQPEKPEPEPPAAPAPSAITAAPETKPVDDPAKETYASMPKPKYNPMHSHKVHHAHSYASTVIADQETLLANLRHMRRELDKEDRQLTIMAKTLFNQEYPRKWTPPNRYTMDNDL